MTTYAHDPAASILIAVWETGLGSTARTVARLHARAGEREAQHLARALTELSTAAWLDYTDPRPDRTSVDEALRAVRRPHLPVGGLLRTESDSVLDRAHEAGRAVLAIGSAGVARAVTADVAEELDAVDRAARGDLSDRACQAVVLTRLDVSPVQVAMADRLLREVPMGGPRLFSEVDPTAAAVAALHWLQAAVAVTGALAAEPDPGRVVARAAAVEGDEAGTPLVALDLVAGGSSPLLVVQLLVRSAVLAARGLVVQGGPAPDDRGAVPCMAVLDPTRPGCCLLERLTRSIQTCCLLYAEHLEPAALPDAGDGDRMQAARDHFDDAVRAEAARTAERLGTAA